MGHLTYQQIQALADGTLGESERKGYEGHVSACPHCRREIALQQSLVRAIRHLPLVKPCKRFTRNVMEQILPQSRGSTLFRLLGGTGKIIAMSLVLAVIVFALTRPWSGTVAESQQNQSEVTKLFSQYYAQAQRVLVEGSDMMGKTMANQSNTGPVRILTMTFLSLIGLALIDKYILRPILKMKL